MSLDLGGFTPRKYNAAYYGSPHDKAFVRKVLWYNYVDQVTLGKSIPECSVGNVGGKKQGQF